MRDLESKTSLEEEISKAEQIFDLRKQEVLQFVPDEAALFRKRRYLKRLEDSLAEMHELRRSRLNAL